MGVDQEVARGLMNFFVPIIFLWFFIGLAIAVLYHLSLYYIDGEFRVGQVRMLDIAVSILRGLAYFIAWPGILFFDRTAIHRIKLFLLYLSPKQRKENEELIDAMKEGKYRVWVRDSFLGRERVEKRRKKERDTWQEHSSRLLVLHEGDPRLESIWMLTGVGTHPGAVKELVRLCPNYYLVDEVTVGARREIELRRPWNCLRCGTSVPAIEVRMPGLTFLRIVEPDTRKTVVEGWALRGSYTMRFEQCPNCDAEQPDLTEDLSRFGRAVDVVRAMRDGMVLHWDLP